MNPVELWTLVRSRSHVRGAALCAFAILASAHPLAAATADAAPPAEAVAEEDNGDSPDDVVSLAAYNVQADRIEDFGFRIRTRRASDGPSAAGKPSTGYTTLVTFWFWRFAPMITQVLPNTAAANAGLQPGERILKSEGESTVGGLFSTGKFGHWRKTEKKKWAEVASGKKRVTWTLEVQSPVTHAVRTVTLVVPTPPPHWGASLWRPPQGRPPSTVTEAGPLAGRCRTILDNGIWTLLDWPFSTIRPANADTVAPLTGYEWRIGETRQGSHRMLVTQLDGRTHVFFETYSPGTGRRIYQTSPAGALEKAWRWTRKDHRGAIPLAEAREGFVAELDLWSTKVDKVSARWPLGVKPGVDHTAIFAALAANEGTLVAPVRPFAEQFLKLSRATPEQQGLFADAYAKLGVDQEHWAYTETSRHLEDKQVTVTRVDPSKPEVDRCVLLSINGKPPTPEGRQRWRDAGGDVPKALGDMPPLASLVDLQELRVYHDEPAAVVFELPIRSGNAEFPTEKLQALFRVNKTYRSFEDITIKMRESFRVAGVVKITQAGLQAHFQTLDPAYPPQPVSLQGGGAARILLIKLSRDFETTRTDFKRVDPYAEP